MQLIFKREEDESISIEIKDGVSTIEFDYVEMIKKLLSDNNLEQTLFEGDISDEEKEKINEMVLKINQAIMVEDEDVSENESYEEQIDNDISEEDPLF